jgi:hypothetical protein
MDIGTTSNDAAPTNDSFATSEASASVDSQPEFSSPDAGAQAPVASAPASAPSPSIDYQALAHAVAQANRPVPPPQKNPWDTPDFYKLGVPEEKIHEELHSRFSQHAKGVVQSEIQNFAPAVKQYVQDEIQKALAQAGAKYAIDPAFAKVEPIFNSLVAKGIPPSEARELANFRAGIGARGNQPSPGATAPKVPSVPAHAAANTSRPPAAPANGSNGLPAWKNVYDKKERLSRWNALADRLGFPE